MNEEGCRFCLQDGILLISRCFYLGLPQAEGWLSAGDYIANFTGVLTFLWRYVTLSNISARISPMMTDSIHNFFYLYRPW